MSPRFEFVDPRRFRVNEPPGPIDAVLARQILASYTAMWGRDDDPDGGGGADGDAHGSDDDGAAIAAATATLTADPLYVRWGLARDGAVTHHVVVYPDGWYAIAFVADTAEPAATLGDDGWTGADPELVAGLPTAFAEMQAAEEARLRAAHAAARAQRGEPAPVRIAGGPDVGAVTFVRRPSVGADQLDAVDQRRAALAWRFVGEGDGDIATLDDLLSDDGFVRWDVVGPDGVVMAQWWGGGDGGLLFRAGTATLIGEAIQHGFVCRDHALWRSIGAADSAPGGISWQPPDELSPGHDRLWIDPPDPEPLWKALFGDA